jgi:pimeloyl-ACP methyl ester carboxylesterase
MQNLLIAIHGILTRQTDPSWPDQLDVWMAVHAPGTRVLKKEYSAGPFPRWNCWIKNPRLCCGLAAEALLFMKGAKDAPPQVWLVAHSNGALVALGTARRLIALGHTVSGVILIGAACEADIDLNGVRGWICQGRLGRAIAYCAADDHVLPGGASRSPWSWLYRVLAWPYGNLGRVGWTSQTGCGRHKDYASERVDVDPRVITRWFAGGHSGYFSLEQIEYTFRQILRDISNP